MKNFILITLMLFAFTFSSQAQTVTMSKWEMNRGQGHIQLAPHGIDMKKAHGNPVAYELAKRPAKTDSKWEDAPTDTNGDVNFSERSSVPCFKAVDFTYFRAYVDIPSNASIQHLTVTIGQVDDGARMFIYNSRHDEGVYHAESDAKLAGKNFTVDFSSSEFAKGEINTIMIVQMDDCAVGNVLKGGITIKADGTVIKPSPTWKKDHDKFDKDKTYAGSNSGSTSGASPGKDKLKSLIVIDGVLLLMMMLYL